jgi:uncharacterized protein YbbC (DUF1343 family)
MKLALEACLEHGVRFIVLDRPNPLGGLKVDGPGLDAKWRSYVGALRVPYVHGLTIGELALAAAQTIGWLDISDAARRRIADAANASAAAATAARAAARAPNTAAIVTAHSAPRPAPPLEVILMRGWRRSMRWRDTGLRWTPTSPRIPHVDSVDFYPITGLGCELDNDFTHGATGRDKGSAGYIWPFRFIRHETRNWATVERALRARRIPGLAFTPLAMRDGTKGILVSITDWQRLRPTELNFHMMQLSCAWAPHGNPFKALPKGKRETFIKHLGSEAFFNALCRDGARLNLTPWLNQWSKNARNFQNWSRQFWLYKT